MSLTVRDKVEILNSEEKVIGSGTIINYNDFREPGMEYAVIVDGYDDVYFFGEKQLKKSNDSAEKETK